MVSLICTSLLPALPLPIKLLPETWEPSSLSIPLITHPPRIMHVLRFDEKEINFKWKSYLFSTAMDLWHEKGTDCRAQKVLHCRKETMEYPPVSQPWWEKTEIPKNSMEWSRKPVELRLTGITVHTHWFFSIGSLSWLTCELHGDTAQLMFPGVLSRMSVPLPTIPGCLAESPVHHIFTGINWNSASDTGSRCKQLMSSKRRELGEMLLPEPFQIKKGYGKAHGFSGKKKRKTFCLEVNILCKNTFFCSYTLPK